jgi:hypothetical protein
VDWIEIEYPRQAEAENDFLAFDITDQMGGSPLRLEEFNGPIAVVDVTTPTETTKFSGVTGENGFLFLGEVGHRYLAADPKGLARPAYLAPMVFQLRKLTACRYFFVQTNFGGETASDAL